LLNHGLPIPVSVWNLFHAWDASILNHGASRQIKIMIGREMFDAALINQNFNQQKFPGHKDIIQIRYSENSPIAKRLRAIFYKSYDYLAAQRQLEENNRKQISLPDNLRELIVVGHGVRHGVCPSDYSKMAEGQVADSAYLSL